jgi:glucose/arabinose dehydrogenase
MTDPATVVSGRLCAHPITGLLVLALLFLPTLGAGVAAAQPGLSPLDRSNPAASRQDPDLKGHLVPPTVTPADRIPISRLTLPKGFKAEIWSQGHPGGRTMAMGPRGTLFVGTRGLGRVYAIRSQGGRMEVKTILQGLTQPNGIVVHNGALYVFAINEVLRFDNVEDKVENLGPPVKLTDAFGLPPEAHHNWKYVAFGPDGKLYVQVGANCNICEINPGVHAQIRRYNADGSGMEIVARGVRNTVGFDWHPVTGDLWFTDNGRDWAGDDGPQDELNRLPRGLEGARFGFPYCHANGIPDPEIKVRDACAGVVMPAALTGPHVAGLGVRFYTGTMFPAQYRNAAFIARHGSWNRGKKAGFDVVVARTRPDGTATIEPFMTGLLDEKTNEFFGRPAYIHQLPDGSLLVSDENNGAIYRISYGG